MPALAVVLRRPEARFRPYTDVLGQVGGDEGADLLPLADAEIRPAIDAVKDGDRRVVFCLATDGNGFLPTHNREYCQLQRPDDAAWNTAHCRNRRIFDDRTGILAARSTAAHLIQAYLRDMGGGQKQMLKEFDAPIVVQGRQWGAVRLAITP